MTDNSSFDSHPSYYGPAIRMARFIGSIIAAASLQPSGQWVIAAIECRSRPGHRRCPGWTRVRRTDSTSPVEWHCTSCNYGGFITSWSGSEADLGQWRQEPGKQNLLHVLVFREELRELRKMVAQPENPALIEGAVVIDGNVFISGNLDDFEDITGCVVFEVNCESKRKRRDLLGGIVDRMEAQRAMRSGLIH